MITLGRHGLFHEVAPLDDRDAVVDQLVEAQVVEVLDPVEAVHVDVLERRALRLSNRGVRK